MLGLSASLLRPPPPQLPTITQRKKGKESVTENGTRLASNPLTISDRETDGKESTDTPQSHRESSSGKPVQQEASQGGGHLTAQHLC